VKYTIKIPRKMALSKKYGITKTSSCSKFGGFRKLDGSALRFSELQAEAANFRF